MFPPSVDILAPLGKAETLLQGALAVVELVPTPPHANANSPVAEGCGAVLVDYVPLEE
jgi:hypothetical protein